LRVRDSRLDHFHGDHAVDVLRAAYVNKRLNPGRDVRELDAARAGADVLPAAIPPRWPAFRFDILWPHGVYPRARMCHSDVVITVRSSVRGAVNQSSIFVLWGPSDIGTQCVGHTLP
jgi:hypothetical protein